MRNGVRERERSLALRVASLRGGSLSSPSHASEFIPRAAGSSLVNFSLQTSFARETFLSAIECVFRFR